MDEVTGSKAEAVIAHILDRTESVRDQAGFRQDGGQGTGNHLRV